MYKQEKKLVRIDSKKGRILTFHRMQSISQHHNSHYHPTHSSPGYQDTRKQTLLCGGGSRGQKEVWVMM